MHEIQTYVLHVKKRFRLGIFLLCCCAWPYVTFMFADEMLEFLAKEQFGNLLRGLQRIPLYIEASLRHHQACSKGSRAHHDECPYCTSRASTMVLLGTLAARSTVGDNGAG